MLRLKYALLGLILIAIAGCNRASKENTAQQPAPAAPPPAAAPAPAPMPPEAVQQPAQPEPVKPAEPVRAVSKPAKKAPIARKVKPQEAPVEPVKPQPAPEPPAVATAPVETPRAEPVPETPVVRQPQYAVIPNGTRLNVRLQSPLDTAVNISGDTFRAILDEDIRVGGNVIAPRGSILEGKLSHVERSGRVQGRANMSMQLTNLLINDATYPIQTEILTFEAQSSMKKDASKVGIGAGIGAVIGAIAGGGKGAAIGAAVGAGAGGATAMATRGNELKFEAEHQLTFALQRDIRVRLR